MNMWPHSSYMSQCPQMNFAALVIGFHRGEESQKSIAIRGLGIIDSRGVVLRADPDEYRDELHRNKHCDDKEDCSAGRQHHG